MDPSQGLGQFGAMGGMMAGSGLGQLLGYIFGSHNMPNPADKAMPYLQQIPGGVDKYMQPYANSGAQARHMLKGQYGELVNDPSAKLAEFGKGFQQDPGYQYALNQGEQGITNAAAAGGMAGTPMHQQRAGEMATNMANQQYQQYLNNVLGLYGQGMAGEQGLNKMGYGANNEMAQALAQALMQQSNLSYAGQANQNQYKQQQEGNMWGGIGNILGGLGGLAAMFL